MKRLVGVRWRLAAPAAVMLLGMAGCLADEESGSGVPADDPPPSAEAALRGRAGELLPVVERLSKLPALEPLRMGVRSREELESFLSAELAEKFAGDRVSNVMRVYTLLGLVPEDLDIEQMLRGVLLEQVVGFYDPGSDTLFVVDGVARELVDAVLVHEMVHALQDQYMDLDSLTEATRADNDAAMAAQAALEGHATFVMVEWMMGEQLGSAVDLTEVPPLGETLGDNPLALVGSEMPALMNAPTVIREQLMFPYVAGLDFVQARWGMAAGRVPPLGEALPATTEQVLHPDLSGSAAHAPRPPRFSGDLPGGWRLVYEDGLGEFDTRVFLREYLPDRMLADNAAAGWGGDRYRLLESPEGESLVWVSRWDSERDAREFAGAAQRAFRARYEGVDGRSVSVRLVGRQLVRVEDVPATLRSGLPPAVVSLVEERADE